MNRIVTRVSIRYFSSWNYAKLEDVDIDYFRRKFGENSGVVVVDPLEIEPHVTDWLKKYKGFSRLVLKPKNTQQVADIVKYCNERKLPIVVQGGNTGLVGGATPIRDEICLSMTRMNKIESIDPVSGTLVCESGCVLQTLDTALAEHGLTMPLDLGAKGSCQIGGNVATNAGGLRLVRFGNLHGTVLGLEVVQADGTILNLMNTLKKDNTGYDLKQLFIGSEGTLGIITKVAISTPKKPASVHVAYLGCSSFENVLLILAKAKSMLGEILSAIEFQDRESLELCLTNSKDPLSQKHAFYVLIETMGSNELHDAEKLEVFLSDVLEGPASDGTLAQDSSQIAALWKLRENVAEGASRAGCVYKYDVSLPTKSMYALVEQVKSHVNVKCVGYGHLGDGNLHLNVIVPKYSNDILNKLEPYVFERVRAYSGSISAEHGIGQGKVDFLHYSKSPEAISMMQAIKATLDPNRILNPNKVLSL